MISQRLELLVVLLFIAAAQASASDHAPQPADDLRPMLKITWSRGPDLPQGFQDSDGGFVGDTLVTVGGFCSGVAADNAKKPGRYPRGFLNKTWGFGARCPTSQVRRAKHSPPSSSITLCTSGAASATPRRSATPTAGGSRSAATRGTGRRSRPCL